jgi:hypothetical protein
MKMTREIGTLRLVMPGITVGLTKLYAEYKIEDGDMRERSEPLKFKGVDFTRTVAELWQDAKEAIVTKEKL